MYKNLKLKWDTYDEFSKTSKKIVEEEISKRYIVIGSPDIFHNVLIFETDDLDEAKKEFKDLKNIMINNETSFILAEIRDLTVPYYKYKPDYVIAELYLPTYNYNKYTSREKYRPVIESIFKGDKELFSDASLIIHCLYEDKDEEVIKGFNSLREFKKFLKSDIYNKINTINNEEEKTIVMKALGYEN